ncbi:MAG: PorT family protein [Cyclobacteriaceae bacterium]|nr:PorT family protein [Cyclobacteriaceae bacterium]
MKSFLALCLIGFMTQAYGQNDPVSDRSYKENISLFMGVGVATQIHSYPTRYIDASFAEWLLPVMGAGVGYTFFNDLWFSIRPQIGYIQKGCTFRGRYSTDSTGTSIYIGYINNNFKYNNTFHYLTADILLKFKVNTWKAKPYIITGLRNEMLLAYSVDYDISQFAYQQFIFETSEVFSYGDQVGLKSKYDNFSKLNYGMVNGIGVEFTKGRFIELSVNHDIGYLINDPGLKVQNNVVVITVGARPYTDRRVSR